MRSILLLCLCAAVAGKLILSVDSIALQEREIFTDEFPACVPSEVNGLRRLLRFSIRLTNTGPEVELGPHAPPLFYRYGAVNGSLPLDCLRDSHCSEPATPTHFTCRALSVNCSVLLSAHLPCQWLDITDLPPSPVLTLQLADGEALTLPVPQQLPHSHRPLRITGLVAGFFSANLLLILISYKK